MAKKAAKKTTTKTVKRSPATKASGTAQVDVVAILSTQLKALRDREHAIGVEIAQMEKAIAILRPQAPGKATVASSTSSSAGEQKKPRDYDMLKEKITGPMTMVELEKATGKKSGTLQQTMQSYPGLLKSDGKRPATYTFDTSR